MIPLDKLLGGAFLRVPRMRGDDPAIDRTCGIGTWVFPACAGMIPVYIDTGEDELGVPRMRGDDPRFGHER